MSLVWLAQGITADSHVWQIIAPMALFGVGNAFVWAPNSATATRNLPMQLAGAGAGVYNATRQLGAVVAAGIAVLMDARDRARAADRRQARAAGRLPDAAQAPFAESMSTGALPAGRVFLIGLVAALFFERPRHAGSHRRLPPRRRPPSSAAG